MITEIDDQGIDGVFTAADSERPLRGVLALGGSDARRRNIVGRCRPLVWKALFSR